MLSLTPATSTLSLTNLTVLGVLLLVSDFTLYKHETVKKCIVTIQETQLRE